MKNKQGPKVLIADIETAPIMAYCWGLFDQNVGLNQIKKDWHLLSWSAKWLDEKQVFYQDQRGSKDIEDDKALLQGIWKLLDDCDILVTQNGKRFDHKKLNARFVFHGMQPPSSYKQIDTLEIAKKHFAFTSNKLEYMCDKLCVKYKKLVQREFAGFDLWKECLAGNRKAWNEMEKYNRYDVLALEELYHKLIPWDNSIDFNLYNDSTEVVCKCGSKTFIKKGFILLAAGKYQKYRCLACGAETRSKQNLLGKGKRTSLRPSVARS